MKYFNYKTVTSIVLYLISAIPGWAFTIKGRIMVGKVSAKQIELKLSDKEGKELDKTVTDENGIFIINNPETEKIIIETIGDDYIPLILEVAAGETDIDLGTLNIKKIIELKDVTVSAKSRLNTPDKTIIVASQLEKERAADPFNMLTILSYKAPQIQVKESERILTIEGEEPQILVNGIKRDMTFISSLKPDMIDKIEFSTLPDIRYGKRYLNIITRKLPEGGWIMANLRGALTTQRYFLSAVAEYTKGSNDFMLYYDGTYRHGHKEYIDEMEHYTYTGENRDATLILEGKPSSTLNRQHAITLNYTFIPSERHMLIASASLNIHNSDRNINGMISNAIPPYQQTNLRGFKYLRPGVNLYYYLKCSENTLLEFNALCSYSNYSSYRNLCYSTGYDSHLSAKSPTCYFSAEALWKQTLPFGSLNTGIDFSYNDTRTKYLIDNLNSGQSLTSSKLNAYTSLSGDVLTVGYTLSAGMTYYKVENSMFTPDLMASLKKKLGDYFGIYYYFRFNPFNPNISNYNEMATPVNDLMYNVGTDRLKSQQNMTNQLQLAFNKDKFYASIQGSLINNSRPLIYIYEYHNDPASPFYGFFTEIPANGKSFRSYGTDFNIGVSNLWKFLSFKASGGWGHNQLKTPDTFTFCSWYLNLDMALYWRGWQINMTAENVIPSWSMWGMTQKIRRWPYTSLAIYKNIGNWNFNFTWSNLFSRYGGRYRCETLSQTVVRSSEYRMNDQGNLLEIGIRYQFNSGKLLNKKSRSINSADKGEHGMRWDY